MVDIALGFVGAQCIQGLLFTWRTQRGDGQHLRFTPVEEPGAVGAWRQPYFAPDRPDRRRFPAIGSDALVKDALSYCAFEFLIQHFGYIFRINAFIF